VTFPLWSRSGPVLAGGMMAETLAERLESFPIHPLGDRVIIMPDEAPGQSKGGILLPEKARERPARGTVLAVGPGKRLPDGGRAKVDLKPGLRVLYGRYAGSDVELAGETVVVVREEDVHAVLDPAAG
jgi:chaperonin GroES